MEMTLLHSGEAFVIGGYPTPTYHRRAGENEAAPGHALAARHTVRDDGIAHVPPFPPDHRIKRQIADRCPMNAFSQFQIRA